jgi:peptide/nickel transport system substrate-binding protein
VADFEPGRFLSLEKDPDWWGANLPFNRGQHNFDEIRYEWFGDGEVAFEAFRGGAVDIVREFNIAKWKTAYDFPAVRRGEVEASLVPHDRPSGIRGFVMNTRRAPFDDWRVRDAMIHAFNFEFINQAINAGEQPRITSYFSNSVLGMEGGPAEGRVRDLLAPHAEALLPGAIEGYSLPVSDGSEANRRNTREALRLLADAGFRVQDGVMTSAEGDPLRFDILLQSGGTQMINVADLYVEALERIGVDARVVAVDSAQYKERTQVYDFDMTYYTRGLSLSPGNEQMLYWGSDGVEQAGTRNWMGMASPAAEAMIREMLTAESQEGFRAAVKALDRVLTTGRYVVPIWHSPVSRLAHKAWLAYPEDRVQMYGDWIGFLPDVWWSEK